jgi:integrase
MARHSEGWKLKWKRGIAHVVFTHARKRWELSTQKRDPGEASQRAAELYAQVIDGSLRRTEAGAIIDPRTPIEELVADWIIAITPELGEETPDTYQTYGKHWVRHFDILGRLNSAGIGDYGRARLGKVQRPTVVKERTALKRFCEWLVEQGALSAVPDFPKLPKKATGTKHAQGREAPESTLAPPEIEAVLAKLPERSRGLPAKAWFTALYETSLRPATLRRIRPEHITPFGLQIPGASDKNRLGRVVPLTERARWALESVPFGDHDYRGILAKAVKEALGEDRKVMPYDFRHGRITEWYDAGAPETGIEFLSGTKQALAKYRHASRRAAEQTLWGHSGAAGSGASVAPEQNHQKAACEGGDLNPHGSYPASTSIKSESETAAVFEKEAAAKHAVFSSSILDSGAGPQNSDEAEFVAAVAVHRALVEAAAVAHSGTPKSVTLTARAVVIRRRKEGSNGG